MGVHRRRGHAVAEKEVNRETRPALRILLNLSLVMRAEGNESGRRTGVSAHRYLEARSMEQRREQKSVGTQLAEIEFDLKQKLRWL